MIAGARAHRLLLSALALALATLAAGVLVLTRADANPASRPAVLGPEPVTVTIEIDRSRFHTAPIRVRPHTTVRFVVRNDDPIGHELIVGSAEVHERHAGGHEAAHAPVPGEVSVPAEARASTTYTFHAPGPVAYACHLPGHYAYGMHGVVEVVADRSGA